MTLFATFLPAPALRPYIEVFWTLDVPSGHVPPLQRMPADGRIELIFSFAGDSRREAADGSDQCEVRACSFLLGTREKGYTLEHTGVPRYVAVRFHPGGWAAFTPHPLSELSDVYLLLDNLWPPADVRSLEDQIASAPAPQDQVRVLEAALLARLEPFVHLAPLRYALTQLTDPNNAITMPVLSDAINVSQKHLERLFARYVGMRPKLFRRIARFQWAMSSALRHPADHSLGHLAQQAGYYDQAHFIRDFKHFSGLTPSQFFVQSHDFVQLAAGRKYTIRRTPAALRWNYHPSTRSEIDEPDG